MSGTSDINIRKPESGKLNGRFSSDSKRRIESYLASFVSFKPVLVLLYGNSAGADPGSWSMQAVSESMANELAQSYARFGAVTSYELDGIRVVVPQLVHISKLDSGVLTFNGNRLQVSVTAGSR